MRREKRKTKKEETVKIWLFFFSNIWLFSVNSRSQMQLDTEMFIFCCTKAKQEERKGFEFFKENNEKMSYFNFKYILKIQNYLILNYEVQKLQIVKTQKYLNTLFRDKGWILNQNQCWILKFPMADFQWKNHGRGLLFLLLFLPFLRDAGYLLSF